MPQLYTVAQVSSKTYNPTIWYRLNNLTTSRLARSAFDYDAIKSQALAWAGTDINNNNTKPTTAGKNEVEIPDEKWWNKLCEAMKAKHPHLSRYGAKLLQDRVVRALGSRVMIEEMYSAYKSEIEDETQNKLEAPIFIVGLPRCCGRLAHHLHARSGHFTSFSTSDVMFPSFPSQSERRKLCTRTMRMAKNIHPSLQSVVNLSPESPDSDVMLQLLCPRSLAWGMMHGLPDYLYECSQEDQEHVFEFERKILKIFQWYKKHDEFDSGVIKEYNHVEHTYNLQRHGRKNVLTKFPFIVHSPFAILHMKQLHKVFPDMRIIWCHRALSQCVGSTCASLAIHNSMYTAQSPTQSQLCQIGELVCGIFGSGTEQAIQYLADFPYSRMVHWNKPDITRSGVRLLNKTIDAFNLEESDHHYKQQMVQGYTEFVTCHRPKLDHELAHFGLHEGVVGEAFQAYAHQFEEYAYEPLFGITVQDYVMIGNDYTKQRFVFDADKKDRQTSFPSFGQAGKTEIAEANPNRTSMGIGAQSSPYA